MNFRQWGEKYLTDSGVWPKDAPTIVAAALEGNPAMKEVADRGIEGYPSSMLAVFALMLNHAAIKWIDANCPMAFYRSMFENS